MHEGTHIQARNDHDNTTAVEDTVVSRCTGNAATGGASSADADDDDDGGDGADPRLPRF